MTSPVPAFEGLREQAQATLRFDGCPTCDEYSNEPMKDLAEGVLSLLDEIERLREGLRDFFAEYDQPGWIDCPTDETENKMRSALEGGKA